jgi:hypothetical protein
MTVGKSRISGGTKKAKLQIVLGGANYYSGICQFLNWWKVAGPTKIYKNDASTLDGAAVWSAGIYLDEDTGDLVNPVPLDGATGVDIMERIFFAPGNSIAYDAGFNYSGETWVCEWDGAATVTAYGAASQATVNAHKITFTMPSNPGNTTMRFVPTDANDPPRNIRVYQSRYATNVANGETFNPDWIEQISQFGRLRFMDLQHTNNNYIADFDQFADEGYSNWAQTFSSVQDYGPKGGLHPSIICKIANATRCAVHVNLPIRATDACITEFATYMRDNTRVKVDYELSNEIWHFAFQQATYCSEQAVLAGMGDWREWFGYRSAQMMKIIKDIYNDGTRWGGVLNGQGADTGSFIVMKAGFDAWKTETSSALNYNDLYKSHQIAPYTGYQYQEDVSRYITGITKANPAEITCSAAHGWNTGKRVKIFVNSGMTDLNNTFHTITKTANDKFTIPVNTSGYPDFVNVNQFAIDAALFDLMDRSETLNGSNPTRYPTKYQYFNEEVTKAWKSGSATTDPVTGTTYTLDSSVTQDTFVNSTWPAQKSLAESYGVELRQYEAGYALCGDVFLAGWGSQPQFVEFLCANAHSAEPAALIKQHMERWHAMGLKYPSQFTECGVATQFGAWNALRFWPTVANGDTIDTDNPRWQAMVEFNDAP